MLGRRKQRQPTAEQRSLLDAADRGDFGAVESLLSVGANPNAHGDGDASALIRAVDEGHLPVVRTLVGAGADVNYEDDAGDTPLNCASSTGAVPIVELLIEAGADVNARNRFHVTPMTYAQDRPAVARALSEAGAVPHDPEEVARLARRARLLERLVGGAFLLLCLSLLTFLVFRMLLAV